MKLTFKRMTAGLLPMALALLMLTPAQAQQPDPKQLVRDTMEYLDGLDAVSVTTELDADIALGGPAQELQATQEIVLRGEDELYTKFKTQEMGGVPASSTELYVSEDGTYVYNATEQQYLKAPPEQQQDPEGILGAFPGMPFNAGAAWISALMHANEAVLDQVTDASYIGEETVTAGGEEVQAHHVQLSGEKDQVDLWLRAGEKPLPERLTIDMTKAFAGMAPEGQQQPKLVLDYTFSDWNTSPELAEDRFQFTPPEDAEEIDLEEIQQSQSGGESGGGISVGQDAPEIELSLLDGGKLDLSEHKGEDVVMLDFWATWCGPCRQGLPIVDKVAADYADQNVVFYAVNIQEQEDKIKSFLEQMDLDLKVALDKKGAVATEYGATSIPRTVIIGKDGKIKAVHTGVSAALERQLRSELDELT